MTEITDCLERAGAELRIRRYTREDAAACCAVVRSAVSAMSMLGEAARALITAHAAPEVLGIELTSFGTLVAEERGVIIGLGALDHDEIKRVYVHPSAQGRGVGRAVVALLERAAGREGYGAVSVVAGVEAVDFYARLGYERLDHGEHVIGGVRVPFVTMRKAILPDGDAVSGDGARGEKKTGPSHARRAGES